MLGMPTARVRELAREALGDLAPATAARVDSDWRGQIADYVLGQQTGPESTATRGHLKRSEPARAWAYSLLDSLGHLYAGATPPEIPEADGSTPPAPQAAAPEKPAPARPEPAPAAAPPPTSTPPRPPGAAGGGLSPAAQAVVKRRRIIGAAAAIVVIAVVVLLVSGVFSGGGGKKVNSPTTSTGAAARGTAYEVWLYNSPSDARALGAQLTDSSGNLQGRGNLPKNWQRFRSVLLSRENLGGNPKSPSNKVLQATLADVPAGSAKSKNGIKIVAEGVLKAARGEAGTGVAVVLTQNGQQQLVVQAARLSPTTSVVAPATGTGTGSTNTTPGSTTPGG
jgi:hypothetical protein